MSTEEARARLQLQGLDPSQLGYGSALQQLEGETERRRQDQSTMNQLRVNNIQDQGQFLGGILPNLLKAYRGGKDYARNEASEEQMYNQRGMEMKKLAGDIEEAQAKQAVLNSNRPGQTQNRRTEAIDAELNDAVLRRQEAAQRRKLTDLQIAQGTQGMQGTTHDRAVVQYRQALNNPSLMAQLDSQYQKTMTPAELTAIKGEAARPDYMAMAARQAAVDATPEGASLRETKQKAQTYKAAVAQMQAAAKTYAENQHLGGVLDTSKAKDATKEFADALRSIGESEQADAIEANFAQRLASGDLGKTRSDVMQSALAGVAHKAKTALQASASSLGQYGQDRQLEDTYDYLDSVANSANRAQKNAVSPVTGQPVSYGVGTSSPWGQGQPSPNSNPFRGAAPAQQQPPPQAQPGQAGGQMIYTGTVPNMQPPPPALNPSSFRGGSVQQQPPPGRGL